MTGPRTQCLARCRRGSTAVEFAILAPIFILLMMGMVAYGVYFAAAHSLQQIAADAARTSVAGVDRTERQALAQGFVTRNAGDYAFIRTDGLKTIVDDAPDGTQFTIALSYDAASLPIWSLVTTLPLPPVTIERRATVRLGGT